MKANFNFSLSPKEAVEYLKGKGLKKSFNYEEIMHEAHHTSFTVAKVTRDDLLLDIHHSINKAIDEGIPFAEWKKSIKPTLKSYGWWGTTTVEDPNTKEKKEIYVGARRLKTIFYTNMRVAYAVGRYKQLKALPSSIYWRYNSLFLPTSRDTHKSKDGIIKHRDDPFWAKNYPPNAWNCVCYVTAHRESEIKRNKWKITKHPIEDIAHKDWAYDVGAGSRVGKLQKIDLDSSLEKLPSISNAKKSEYKYLSKKKLFELFAKTLGVKKGEMFVDKIGDGIPIDDSFFTSVGGNSKFRDKRSLYIKDIALALKDPDEIFIEPEFPDGTKKRRHRKIKKYLRYYKSKNSSKRAMQVIVEISDNKSLAVTAYYVDSSVEDRRKEYLIYAKERKQN